MAQIKMGASKVKNDLIYTVLDQMGDSASDITSQTIREKIKKTTGFDVDNQYIEDFMQGLSMRVQSYITTLTVQLFSGYMVEALASGELISFIKKHRKQVIDWMKNIPDLMKVGRKGGAKGVYHELVAFGKGEESTELANFRTSFDTYMTCQNVNITLGNALKSSDVVSSIHEANRAIEGDSRMLGSTQLLKAVMEFKATAKQGF